MRSLVKHTIVIWSEEDMQNEDIATIAAEATSGDAYCVSHETEVVEDPTRDPDWDGPEFFGIDDGEEDEHCQRCDKDRDADEVVILEEGPVCRYCVEHNDLEDENVKDDEEIAAVILTWLK